MLAHRWVAPILLATVPIASIWLAAQVGLGFQDVVPLPEKQADARSQLDAVALGEQARLSLEDAISSLVALVFGLYVFIGFVAQYRGRSFEVKAADALAIVILVTASALSLYFSYCARIEIFFSMNAGAWDFTHVVPLIEKQALFLLVTASATFFLSAKITLGENGAAGGRIGHG